MKKGFTLIEILVVLSLIGILVGFSLVAFQGSRASARDARRKADLEQIRAALEIYRSDNNTYPANLSSLSPPAANYIAEIPTDPASPTYTYAYGNATVSNYNLCAFLETASADTCTALSGCGASGCNYGVTNP